MVELNKEKIQIKYITGINKTLSDYPTPFDVLYDSCVMSVDDKLFSKAKMENYYFLHETDSTKIENKINNIIETLLNGGFIEKHGSSYKIIKTIWD